MMRSGPILLAAAIAAALGVAAPGVDAAPSGAPAAPSAQGACREGVPHGAYELRGADGAVLAIGAYNRGRRTGSFIFWNRAGVRVAHVPYDEDALNGTVALWYADARRDGAPVQKREDAFSGGRRNGTLRAWHPDGRLAVEADYRDGSLADAKAWDAKGRALPPADAREAALRVQSADDAEFRALEDLVRRHPPPGCAPAPSRGGR